MSRNQRWVQCAILSFASAAAGACQSPGPMVYIRSPLENEVLQTDRVTFEVRKRDGDCSFSDGSFEALLDRMTSSGLVDSRVDITGEFSRPPNSHDWTAFSYPLAAGLHRLVVRGQFTGGGCASGLTSIDEHRFETRILTDVVRYETSCGTGEFTFEPYPAILPPGAPSPPIYPMPTDAHCVSPGATIQMDDLRVAYPELSTVERLELAVLHTRWDPNQIGAGGQGVWARLSDPTYYEITSFQQLFGGTVVATIPNVSGEPPAGASIRMTFRDPSNRRHVVDIEEDRRASPYDHGLYFVPRYAVYLAVVDVDIGFDLFDQTVDGTVLSSFSTGLSGGMWEEYCRIGYKVFSTSGFPGTVGFRSPNANVRLPTQGYRVQMPASRTGTFTLHFHVACPEGVPPTGFEQFSDWGRLGDYGGSLIRGMPSTVSVGGP